MKTPVVFLDGPDAVKRIGPLVIEYHRYGGPLFTWHIGRWEKTIMPRLYSPLWIIWALVQKDMERQNGIVDDGEMKGINA